MKTAALGMAMVESFRGFRQASCLGFCILSSAWAGPRIKCAEPEHKFGTVPSSQSVVHDFVIANAGDAILQIRSIRACCGATAKMTGTAIPPGSNSTLHVSLSLNGRNGEHHKAIYLGSNDPTQPYYQLRFVGTAVAAIRAEPQAVDFGVVWGETPTSAIVTVICASNMAMKVTNVVSDATQFIASVDGEVGGGAWRIGVRTVPPLPMGVSRGKVTVMTDHGQHSRLGIPVTLIMASDIVTVPMEIRMQEGGQKAMARNCTILLRSRSGKAFNILNAQAPEGEMNVEWEPLASGGYRVGVSNVMPFEDLDGKDLVITTDHESVTRIAIPFRVVSGGPGK